MIVYCQDLAGIGVYSVARLVIVSTLYKHFYVGVILVLFYGVEQLGTEMEIPDLILLGVVGVCESILENVVVGGGGDEPVEDGVGHCRVDRDKVLLADDVV